MSRGLSDDKGIACDPERWVNEHSDFLFRYAMVRLRRREAAKDVVQETFLAALRNPGAYRGTSNERNWLCGILKNKIIDHFRKQAREPTMTDLEALAGEEAGQFTDGDWIHADGPRAWGTQPGDAVEQREFWVTLRRCLGKLPDRLARAFILREVDGLSMKQVCDLTTISENNLSVMLHRARLGLRGCLETNWFGRPPST